MKEYSTMEIISMEAMLFIRGRYELDEAGNDKDEVSYKHGNETVLTIKGYDNRSDFIIDYGKNECSKFQAQRGELPQKCIEYFENGEATSDGKRIIISVTDLETLEAAKKLVMIKKEPNRRPLPLPLGAAVYARCGMRCDMCVYYLHGKINEEEHDKICRHLESHFGEDNYKSSCAGCDKEKAEDCGWGKLTCQTSKGLGSCLECPDFPCYDCGLLGTWGIGFGNCSADDITWGILPYIGGQYGNYTKNK